MRVQDTLEKQGIRVGSPMLRTNLPGTARYYTTTTGWKPILREKRTALPSEVDASAGREGVVQIETFLWHQVVDEFALKHVPNL